MTERRCSSCGARVAPADERCRSCGNDPDIRLLELGVAGRRRLPSGPTGPRNQGWRRWAPVAVGVAAVWAFFALMGGSGEDEPASEAAATSTSPVGAPTSTTLVPGTTTTTTEVIPGAPLLGEPSALDLVVAAGIGRVIDLDTGAVTRIRARIVGTTEQGVLVDDRQGIASWPPPYDGSGATRIVPATPGTVIEQTWVVGDGTLVWAIERSDGSSDPVGGVTATATLADLDGRTVGRFQLPASAWPAGATDRGLVVGAPGGVYVVGSGGEADRLATGALLAVVGDRIFASNCDEELRCFVEERDDDGRLVEELESPADDLGWPVAAPDGRLAYVVYRDHVGESNQVVIDGVAVYEYRGQIARAYAPGALAWSPDGRWLAIAALDGVHFVDTLGGTGERVVDVGLLDPPSSVIFVRPDG